LELYSLTLHEAHELLKDRRISSLELTKSVIKRIEEVEDRIDSYITLNIENALKQAKDADKLIGLNKELPFLTGIPIAVKDIFCTKGILTTCASKILSNFIPTYDATVVKRILKEHAVIIGKTNMDEFAMGSSTERSYFKITKNPWDTSRVPGGSSGGSASAVAADECIASIGTDTGGSIRQPAALCGVVGMKPTYGRVSRFGMIAFASSLDQGGTLTKDVRDCAILMNIISGYDPFDSTSLEIPVPDYTQSLIEDIKGIKIGVPKEYFIEGMDKDVENSIFSSMDILKKLGATIKEISLPHTEYALPVYYIIAPAEASSNLARYDGVRYGYRAKDNKDMIDMYMKTRGEGFGKEVKRRIMLGTFVLSSGYYEAYYGKAQQVRRLVKNDFDEAFKEVDVIISPTSPTKAFKIGEKLDDPLKMYLSDIFTIPVNLAGITAISIPCGFSEDGLPMGLQIMGNHFREDLVLKVAYTFERNTRYHLKKPNI
jgi:aspartyl-tRNA(Asn)/glutamyl-tRNA(Gln) amidotransferase subunit A